MTRLHIGMALLLALLLHGGLAAWLVLPNQEPPIKPITPIKQIVNINLQTTLLDTLPVPEAQAEPQAVPKITPQAVQQKENPIDKLITQPIKQPSKQPTQPKSEPKKESKPKPKTEPTIKSNPEEVTPSVPQKSTASPQPVPESNPASEPSPKEIQDTKETTPLPTALPTQTANTPKPLDAEAVQKYKQQLAAWLEKHKKYPKRAKRMRIEGEGVLQIVIDRTGESLQVTLKESTGNRLLDKAAMEMAKQANPFPAMPKDDPRQSLEFEVPIAFLLH